MGLNNTRPITGTLSDVAVHHARVLDVDIAGYSVTVATEFAKKPLSGISWSSPYQHFVNGEGMYCMPEVGSLCWVCEPSDGSRPFVLGWAPAQDEGDYRSRKMDLNPGDIYLGTRDENCLILRRGGVVQIGSGPLCQRLYMPLQNLIRDFCENYSLQTIAGAMEWNVDIPDGTTDGKRPTSLNISVRQKANDAKPIANLKIGSHDDDTVLSLLIKASGEDGADTKISLLMDKQGVVTWTIKKDIVFNVTGKYTVEAQGDISIKSTSGKVSLEGSTEFNAKGAQAKMEADSTVTVKGGASAVIDAPSIQIGGTAATSPAVKGDLLLTWLSTHTHTDTVTLAPTSPPVEGGALTSILSTTVLLK